MSAALPSLGRLSLQQPARVVATGAPPTKKPGSAASGPGLHELPPDLLVLILGAVDSKDPCNMVEGLCNSNTLWAGWCRNGWFYDVANSALGYYGAFATWEQVVQHYQANQELPPTSYKEYFRWACRARFDPKMLRGVEQHHPFYGARLLQHISSNDYVYGSFYGLPKDLWNYGAIAKVVVQKDDKALNFVNSDRDDYLAIAKLAFQHNGHALRYVPTDRADYGVLAKMAVQSSRLDSDALRYVPTDRDDYGEIAMLAVQKWGHVLKHVPTDRDDYFAIAKLAVQKSPYALAYVPAGSADFGNLAKLAVQGDGHALQFVSKNRADFGDIAKLAVQEDGHALQWVPTNRDDYGDIAKLAVQSRGHALQWVPVDRDDYDEIAELAHG